LQRRQAPNEFTPVNIRRFHIAGFSSSLDYQPFSGPIQ
jgi:hypothetical protein